MNDATRTAKSIAKTLRTCHLKFDAFARGEKVFVRTSHPIWLVGDFTPPGWNARQVPGKYDVLVVMWIG
jgi:hypothetical protein